MYQIKPGVTRLFFTDGMEESTVGVTVLNSDKSVKIARVTSGVVRLRDDKYLKNLTFPSSSFASGWKGYVKFDDTETEKFIPVKVL